MNYRDLSLKIKVDLKLIAPLYRGRAVTQPRTGTFQSCHRRFLTIQGIVDVDYD